MGKGVWGIDISKYSIKAVRMEAAGGGPVITAAEVAPYVDQHTGEQGNLDEYIRTTLEEMKQRLGIGRERIVLSLPGHSTFNRLIKLPPVDDEKIPEVVKYEAQSQIPFPIDEVIWDYQFVERDYGPGEEKEVILFAIKRDIVEQFLKNIDHLGLNVDAVQFAPVALYNFLSHDQELGSCVVAVDMGADNTDLVIVDGPKFWIRNLPISGNNITKELQKAFNIPFADAEKLKLKAAQSQQAQKIFNAIQPVLRDLIGEVNRSLGYYKSISKTIKFDKVILLGNSTKTLNFQRYVSQSLQMPATLVTKLNRIQLARSVNAGDFNEDVGTMGTAIGLALQGLGESQNTINLLPPAYLKRKELKKKQPYVIGIAAALYLMAFTVWQLWRSEVVALDQTIQKAQEIKKRAEDQNAKLETAKQLGEYEAKLEKLTSISHERDLILKVMNLIQPNIPDNSRRDVVETEKLWILDWQFVEVPRGKPAETAPTGMGAPASTSTYVTDKQLNVTIEGAILRGNRGQEEARNWVTMKLLGYTVNGQRVKHIKDSVIEAFDLTLSDQQGMRWGANAFLTTHLVPKELLTQHGQPEEAEKKYWRFVVTLEIPTNPEVRRKIVEARKAAEASKQPTSGN
ncbi:MAG: type IV pilus assembly protein PilM [Planctomycetes bacterium]|nr:type IV pilus assembly protein PilM [Planctomycetota bacterium]